MAFRGRRVLRFLPRVISGRFFTLGDHFFLRPPFPFIFSLVFIYGQLGSPRGAIRLFQRRRMTPDSARKNSAVRHIKQEQRAEESRRPHTGVGGRSWKKNTRFFHRLKSTSDDELLKETRGEMKNDFHSRTKPASESGMVRRVSATRGPARKPRSGWWRS